MYLVGMVTVMWSMRFLRIFRWSESLLQLKFFDVNAIMITMMSMRSASTIKGINMQKKKKNIQRRNGSDYINMDKTLFGIHEFGFYHGD